MDEQLSLRDTVSAAFDEVTADEPKSAESTNLDFAEPAPASGQPRDEQGRFAPKGEQEAKPAAEPPAPAAEPAAPGRKPPSTWAKERWQDFEAIAAQNPALADYILKRENDYTSGVSTYKQEWDRAKPLMDAIAPFEGVLRQHNLDPARHVANLMGAHQMLALGSPEQKLWMFARLAQDYQVPLHNLLAQGQDGQWYLNAPQAPPQPAGLSAQDVDARVAAVFEQRETDSAIRQFADAKNQDGSPKHPHFEQVRDTMSGLLRSGLADTLDDAYAAALRHPRHAQLWEHSQAEARKADEAKKAAERARRNAVQTRSATPSNTLTVPADSKDLRSMIESNFDSAMSGRV